MSVELSSEEQTVTALPSWLALVDKQVKSLSFGTVVITVHEARVVQIERSEKFRVERDSRSTKSL